MPGMRRSVLGLLACLALVLVFLGSGPSAEAGASGPPRFVTVGHVGPTDWASATDPAGFTAYAFRRAHEVDLRIRRPGGRLSRVLTLGTGPTYPVTPQVSLAADGTGVVVWALAHGSRLRWRVREFDVHGSLGPLRTPIPQDASSRDLRATALTGGRALVTFTQSGRSGRQAYASLLTPRFAASPAFLLGGAAGGVAPWVVAGGRRSSVVWTDGDAIVARRLDVHGVPGPRVSLPNGFAKHKITLSAEATVQGDGVLVGSARDKGVNRAFVLRVRARLGSGEAPTPVSPASQDVGVNGEELAVGTSGAGVVAWTDGISGASYARVLEADGSIGALTRFRAAILAAAVRPDGDGALLLHAPRRRHPLLLARLRRGVVGPAETTDLTPRSASTGATLGALPHGRFIMSFDAGRGHVMEWPVG